MNLTNKFTLAILSIILLVVSVFTYQQISKQTRTLEHALNEKMLLIKEGLKVKADYTIVHVKKEVENDLASYNLSHINQLITQLSEDNEILFVALVAQHNRMNLLKGDMRLYASLSNEPVETVRLTRYEDKPFFEIAAPIHLAQKWGELKILFSLEKLEKELTRTKNEIDTQISTIIKDAILTALLLGGIILALGYFFVKRLTQPILLLTENAKKIADGKLEVSQDLQRLNRKDEVGILANTFEQMNNNLIATYKRLEDSNNNLSALNNSLKERIREAVNKEREKEKLLLHQSRLASMGEMIEQIAHQWRQPLNTLALINNDIFFKVKLNKSDEIDFDEAQKHINESLQYMSQTINDFRDYFHNSGEKVDVAMDELMKTAFALNDAIMKFAKIRCTLESDKGITLHTAKSELLQVFMNLLKNAHDIIIERKIENPCIKAKILRKDEWIHITVEDNAGGIDENIIGKIFEPYFTSRSSNKGTGIGLYMSRTIVEEHLHGTLCVENTAEGARFIISLPTEQ